MDRIPAVPLPVPAVRLHAWYGSAAALLGELSRAVNREQTLLRADSGLPVGTQLVLVMSAECLSRPLEVQGTVTSWTVRGAHHEMTLRYDFDPRACRRPLDQALAELRRRTRRPRRSPRVPLALAADAGDLGPGLVVTVVDVSGTGARLRIEGESLPAIVIRSRLVMRHQGLAPGTRRPLRLTLEVRWVGPAPPDEGRLARLVGGRFVLVSDSMKARLRALLRFEDVRPRLRLLAVEAPPARATARRPVPRRRRLKR